jgi:hypothetical protein
MQTWIVTLVYRFLNFLDRPFVTALLTLVLGGFALKFILQKRAERQSAIEKAVELLDDLSGELSVLFSRLFRCVYRCSPEEFARYCAEIAERSSTLLRKRFSVNVKSKAYLGGGESLSRSYEDLLQELLRIREFIFNWPDGELRDISLKQWNEIKKRIEVNWRLEPNWEENLYLLIRDPPYPYLYQWLSATWERSAKVMSRSLEIAAASRKTRDILPRQRTTEPIIEASAINARGRERAARAHSAVEAAPWEEFVLIQASTSPRQSAAYSAPMPRYVLESSSSNSSAY